MPIIVSMLAGLPHRDAPEPFVPQGGSGVH
jgi:hypothetical protein